jgi:protease-4
MKAYPHLFAKLFAAPLLIDDAYRIGLEAELLARMGVETPARAYGQPEPRPDEDTIEWRKKMAATNRAWRIEQIYEVVGDTAVVTVAGVIDKHLSDFEKSCFGGCDLADVDRALALAAADRKVERIVLNMNTPGGSVTGVPETAARVARLAETKEVRAYCDALCASAGYYIASQADHIAAAPSAVLGSIGVYCAVLDRTRELEIKGIKVQLIKAGKWKAMGAAFQPLTDEERAILQASVDEIYRDFTGAVTSRRPGVGSDTMQGQTFRGTRAAAAGLCDEITSASLDEYVAGLL